MSNCVTRFNFVGRVMLGYEKKTDKPLTVRAFSLRLIWHVLVVLSLLLISSLIGAWGFVSFEGQPFEDALVHAIYLLGGGGVIAHPSTSGGKLFVVFYGLYSKLFILAAFSIFAAPILHRILHKIHLEE